MAVRVDDKPSTADHEGDVSNCVSSLIQAFSDGLNIFKRLRERRRKRKARKQIQSSDLVSSAELQLSDSLRRGPTELAEKYEECYVQRNMGRRFARGDPIAHSSLAETLIKLNTGLVGIIAAFLNHDSSKGQNGDNHLKLDYKSLTNLSDASRREALQSMTSLYQRLSRSQLQIQLNSCANCGSASHSDCSDRGSHTEKEKRKRTSSRQRSRGPTVARMPLKSSSQPQLVVIRSKNTKKGGSDSSSSSSKSTSSSAYTSPLSSPIPEHAVLDPFLKGTPDVIKGASGGVKASSNIARKRVDSIDAMRPTNWQHTPLKHDYAAVAPAYFDYPTPKLPNFTSTLRKSPTSPAPNKSVPQYIKPSVTPSPPLPLSPPIRRRIDKATPSSYTFASDSTKLGEIPQRNWMTPWDYEEAGRLNAEAAMAPVAMPEEKTKTKKGLFKFLR